MTYTTKYDHQKLGEAVRLFGRLEDMEQQPEILAPHQWRIDRWHAGLYILVVVGEVKKGKSSFVNALLECKGLSPVADKIASAVPVKIIFGERLRYWVHSLPGEDGERSEPLEIAPEDLSKYATERGVSSNGGDAEIGNLGNRLAVDFVSVEHPHPLLEEGLVVVDLPGLGGVFKHHARLVWEYLDPERADHIAFVLDSTGHPLAAAERDAIRAITDRSIERFLFLQTKTDCADPETTEAWKQRNLEELSALLGIPANELHYFLISSALKQQWLANGREKDRKYSGFMDLEAYFSEDLLPAKKDLLAEPVLLALSTELDAIGQQIETQKKIYQEESPEKRGEIFDAYQRKKQEFDRWQREVFPALSNDFRIRLGEARGNANDRLQDELFPTKLTKPIYSAIDQTCKSEKNVLLAQEEAKQSCINSSLERYTRIEGDYRDAARAAFSEAIRKLEATIPAPSIDRHLPNMGDIDSISLPIRNRLMEYVQRGWSSAALGGVIGGSVAGPGGALAGTIIGAWKSVSETKQRNKEAALARLKGVLDDAARQAQMQALSAMRKNCDRTQVAYNKLLENAVKVRQQRLKENVDSAAQRLKETDAEVGRHRARLEEKWRKVKQVEGLLRGSAGVH